MEQTITWPDMPDFKLGVSEPILLAAEADTGVQIEYAILNDGEADLQGIQLIPTAIGELEVQATAPAHGEYTESVATKAITVVDGNFYERIEAISKLKKQLEMDGSALQSLALKTLTDIKKAQLNVNSNSGEVVIDGASFSITSKRYVQVFLNSGLNLFKSLLEADQARLSEMITDAKNKEV